MDEIHEDETLANKPTVPLPLHKVRYTSIPRAKQEIVLGGILVLFHYSIFTVFAEALNKFVIDKDVAEHIKKAVDVRPDLNLVARKAPWHCIVGKSYAVAVSHDKDCSMIVDFPLSSITVCMSFRLCLVTLDHTF